MTYDETADAVAGVAAAKGPGFKDIMAAKFAEVAAQCCDHMNEHITCHNGCYELVSRGGLCTKCLEAE